jgi:hypothetical protein
MEILDDEAAALAQPLHHPSRLTGVFRGVAQSDVDMQRRRGTRASVVGALPQAVAVADKKAAACRRTPFSTE